MNNYIKFEVNLEKPVPKTLQENFIKNLFWIDKNIKSIAFSEKSCHKIIVLYEGSDEAMRTTCELLNLTANRLSQNLNKVRPKIFYKSKIETSKYQNDVYPELVGKGWLKEDAEGSFVYSGIMSDLYFALDKIFLDNAKNIGAVEVRIPSLISAKTLINSEYLKSYPHHVNYVFHLEESFDAVQNFQNSINQENKTLNLSEVSSSSLQPKTLLTPAVCQCYYRTLSNQTLQNEIVVVTAYSRCFRYESKATYGIKRLREFGIREVVAVGTAKKVLEFRQRLLETLRQCLERLAVKADILTASDPFFVDNYDAQRLYQISFNLKHEATAHIPFDNSHLAIGSVNYHLDHFGKAWNIKTSDGQTAHSCCMGFGLDRWCYTIFAQYGVNVENWPKAISAVIL